MSYRLREDVSFCQIEDHLVFLDVQNDRYFRLTERAENALLAHMNDCERMDAELGKLVDTGLLIEDPSQAGLIHATSMKGPTRSALEEDSSIHKVHTAAFVEVLATVCSTRWRLKRQKLKKVIDRAFTYRPSRVDSSGIPVTGPMEQHLLKAASLFRSARKYVPVDASCLLDSLSMLQFLTRRRLPGKLVIGVTLEPFSAHCWVQAGSLALNETVGDANAYTPIRIFG